ncbi:SusC/RagA family TonB-linked outer membrane protein [Sphingobacterium sp. UT-1RO-CII-1]|uniref:SusC/RagA family TonB-linked outer membrane protein n=1 Tax=Sphingobacterium sp. UT-1RO-CII-1 TaxID=2995225 RepID=UPI00227BD4C8|nr:SusC/RagA family TonB-linked outer membrane protein [Sphingobacterium sp. UT-1RO-CII-1]MCY4781042.1 SusC/RagA family TonB-linked outer membrane protein [Sphingobacterium sp. UT-1RO-CII-1]
MSFNRRALNVFSWILFITMLFSGLVEARESHARGTIGSSQERIIEGKVTSAQDGKPLAGVTVRELNRTAVTQTDNNGNYNIKVSSASSSLSFSLLGYVEATETIDNRSILNISLIESLTDLDDVIVVAYGTVKKSDFTGSATQIGAKELDKRPLSNVLGALQGAGPGIQTAAPSGAPGSSPTINIRGVGSYSASNNPLIVVDGVPFDGGMSNINPADIETVTVLKDAATIAMYGSRGANGVIMVTTKGGKAGVTNLDVSVQMGTNHNAAPKYNTVSAGEYYELMWQAYTNNLHYGTLKVPLDVARQIGSGLLTRNSAGLQVYEGQTFQDIVQYLGNYNAFNVANDQLVGTDGKLNSAAQFKYNGFSSWEDEASRNGKRNEYNISYSTGIKNTDVYASLNYLDDNGWGLRSSADRFSGRVNANTRITEWLKTGLNISGGTTKFDYAYTGGSSINNPFAFSRGIAPIYPVYLRDPSTGDLVYDYLGNRRYDYGNLVAEYGLSRPYNSGRHAIAETLMNKSRSDRDFGSARTFIEANILPWLVFNTSFSADLQNYREEGYENTEVGDGAPAGRYNQDWYRQLSYTFNQTLRANNTFGIHNLETLLGHEFYSYKTESISGRRTGQGFEGMYVFSNFSDIASLSSGLGETAVESYFARANYNYDSRYYLSAMIRRDGNSRFPEHLRWANFWSVGGAWRLDQESFFANDYTDLFKLRASYGKLGNAMLLTGGNQDYYPYQPGYSIGYNNASASGAALTVLGSNELTWESQKPLDVGVDFSFLKGRIVGSLEYYSRKSDGLLFNVQQPYHNGGTTGGSFQIAKNVGSMDNKGIELSITGNLIRKEDFNWNLGLNLTTIKNKVTKMPEETPEIVSSPYKREVGKSLYEYYTRTYYGVDPETGRALYLGLKEDVTYDPQSEEYKLIDRGNGLTDTVTFDHNAARLSYVGKSSLPPVYGSIVNEFSYKNFDFGFVLTYSLGGYYNESGYSSLMSSGPNNGANLHRDLYGAWQKPGDITDIPLMDVGRTAQNGAMSTRWLQKASYLNISAVNISYRLPESLISQAGIKRARVFASAENLYFWSARKGFNPVGGGLTSVSANSAYTHGRTINFGVNFGF